MAQEAWLAEQDLLLPGTRKPPPTTTPRPNPSSLGGPNERTTTSQKPWTHQRKRMEVFKQMRCSVSKKISEKVWRVRRALDRSIVIPFQFKDLRSTYTVRREPRVYSYEELREIGISTVKWDGR